MVQDLKLDPSIVSSYFAVFDGHGGDLCALFMKEKLHWHLRKYLLDEV